MPVSFAGNSICFNFLQASNAQFPIFSTFDPHMISSSSEQFLKASTPMLTTLSGMITDFK